MKKPILILAILQFVCFFSIAQTAGMFEMHDIYDKRDDETYAVIRIGDTYWFWENLRFESKNSFCPNFRTGTKYCSEGNFYPYTELDTICPKGWRIPTVSEWESYYDYVRDSKKVEKYEIIYDTLFAPESQIDFTNNTITVSDTSEQTNLFASGNLLNLKPLGWVQGKHRKNPGTITLWARNENINDDKYHLHIGDHSYVKHSHKHHIDDKKRKRRKFLVRCVCEAN